MLLLQHVSHNFLVIYKIIYKRIGTYDGQFIIKIKLAGFYAVLFRLLEYKSGKILDDNSKSIRPVKKNSVNKRVRKTK